MTSFRFLQVFLLLLLVVPSAGAQDEQQSRAIKTGTISGRVVNEKGQPLPDAGVSIRAYSSTGIARSTTTDSDGAFQFSGMSPVVYLLTAGFPTYTMAPRDPDSTQSTSYRVGDNVTLVLIKGGVITGRVSTASGEPVIGVRVRAQLIRDGRGERSRYGATLQERTTDDRGIYRFYGLPTGSYLVLAGGGGGGNGNSGSAYLTDAPTYSPSSTRDTAAEIVVQAGEETTNVDIRYRGEQGHTVAGNVSGLQGPEFMSYSVTLTSTFDAGSQWNETTYQSPGMPGFSFAGVADGDYDVTAQSYLPDGGRGISESKRIKVRGADVTGVELATKPLASISGRVMLEDSNAPECKGKRRAAVTETLVSAWHNDNEAAKAQSQFIWSLGGPAYPKDNGEVALRNLAAGQYQIITRLFAKYWYLRSISLPGPAGQQANRSTDVASNWMTLRPAEQLTGLTVTLAEGAASLQGLFKVNEGETLPGRLYVYLVPVEREKEQDVLRFFASPVSAAKEIAVNHIPPGRYWILAQPALEGAMPTLTKLRLPDEKETRAKLRHDAEQLKIEIEFKPCQNVTAYELPLRPSVNAEREVDRK